jgi:photosystem II stability/assembly factor-like uncharacterized protein
MVLSNAEGDLMTWTHGVGLHAEIVRAVVVDPEDPHIAYAGVLLLGEWSIFTTRDGGQTWRQTSPPAMEPIVPDTMALAIAKTKDGNTVLYAGTIGCGILRSTDEGKSWETFGRSRCDQVVDPNMPSDVTHLAIDAHDPDVVYATAGQYVYHSDDGGVSWQRHVPDIDSSITGMVVDSVRPGTVYLITGSDGFWHSEDRGETWQQRGTQWFREAQLTAMAAIPGRECHLLVGASNGGVWMTSDGGETWRFIRENLAVSHITAIATSEALEGKILIGSASDGLGLFVPGRLFGGPH